MTIQTHIPGFPRIGKNRELKRALEQYWKGTSTLETLRKTAEEIRNRTITVQQDLDLVSIGDFCLYDHILSLSVLLDTVPERFANRGLENAEDKTFAMARGIQTRQTSIPACEMRKWFNTNYHYIVPEFTKDCSFNLQKELFLQHFARPALAEEKKTKAILCGPLTYLWLGKEFHSGSAPESGFTRLSVLPQLLDEYKKMLRILKELHYDWIQLDEPVVLLDYLPRQWKQAMQSAWEELYALEDKQRPKLLFTSYFESPLHAGKLIRKIPADGYHFDLTALKSEKELKACIHLIKQIPGEFIVSAGIINGRNIWKNKLDVSATLVQTLRDAIPNELWLSSSCSLLHVPVSLSDEYDLPPNIRNKLSFAEEKIEELVRLKQLLDQKEFRNMITFPKEKKTKEKIRIHYPKRAPFSKRKILQSQELSLPLLPTTSIGSFPQTEELRIARSRLRKGSIHRDEYEAVIRNYIREVIARQEAWGLDVLVHGEPERNDMVEYFSEYLNGFISTRNGWVQSYGSRCVKPPIIHDAISRAAPMTLKWTKYAASLTDRPLKGMLTGPVTLVKWAFPREDISPEEQYYQAALAVAEEVKDLEQAGISIIQIDEAAFREAQPILKKDWKHYAKIASTAFRIASSGAAARTQIHTHMCYSDFSNILDAVCKMDADVLTIETSRSEMELLQPFSIHRGFHHFGPGVYDIHSPAVPSKECMEQRIKKALRYIDAERLWVNPDCGLKTRAWPETEQALKNMSEAARSVRQRLEDKH